MPVLQITVGLPDNLMDEHKHHIVGVVEEYVHDKIYPDREIDTSDFVEWDVE